MLTCLKYAQVKIECVLEYNAHKISHLGEFFAGNAKLVLLASYISTFITGFV